MTRHQFLWLRNQPVCKNLFSVSQWLCSLFVCMSKFPCNVVNVHIIIHVFSSSLCYNIMCVSLQVSIQNQKWAWLYTKRERKQNLLKKLIDMTFHAKTHTSTIQWFLSLWTTDQFYVCRDVSGGSTNEIKGLLNIYFAIRRLTFIALSLLQHILYQKIISSLLFDIICFVLVQFI